MTIKRSIFKVLKYFSHFAYYPTLNEIHTFLPVKIDKKKLKYTPPQYSIKAIQNSKFRIKNSKKKLNSLRFRVYIKLISIFPQIKLVGLSGSISMLNAGEDDDIDLFIITAKNRLFTGRLISLLLAQIIGIRRNRLTYPRRPSQIGNRDKVCLNLFFDENNLKIPLFKQTEFVGHEVLQMKPIVMKDNIYQRFLEENNWVFKLFPNGKSKSQILDPKSQINNKRFKFKILNLFGTWNLGFRIFNKIESLLKILQLTIINRHRTTEIITPTQLWFHPDDYEKKLKKLKIVKNGYKLL